MRIVNTESYLTLLELKLLLVEIINHLFITLLYGHPETKRPQWLANKIIVSFYLSFKHVW